MYAYLTWRGILFVLCQSLGNNRKLIVLQFYASVNYDLIYSGIRGMGEKTKSLIPFKGYILVSSLAH